MVFCVEKFKTLDLLLLHGAGGKWDWRLWSARHALLHPPHNGHSPGSLISDPVLFVMDPPLFHQLFHGISQLKVSLHGHLLNQHPDSSILPE